MTQVSLFAAGGHRQMTSDWAWQSIQPLLSRARGLVYATLAEHGPYGEHGLTAGELTVRLRDATGPRGNESWHRRLEELELHGVVERTRTRMCTITGEQAREWRIVPGVTSLRPLPKHEPGLPKAEANRRLRECVVALEKIVQNPHLARALADEALTRARERT